MDGFVKIWNWLGRCAENLLALLLGSLFVSFLIQIVFRYVLNLPLGWTVEYVSVAWLWAILFGYAFVVKDAEIIRLDIIYVALPISAQRVLDVTTGLTAAGILLLSLPKVYGYVTFMGIEKTAYMHLPFDLVFSIYIPFALAVSIRLLINVWQAIIGKHPKYNPALSAESHDYE